MISWKSCWAITLRHTHLLKQDMNYLLVTIYWPLLDIFTWGFLGSWIQQSQMTGFKNYEAIALMGVLLWQIVGRGCNIIILALSEELWQNYVVNMFSLPLRITEWMVGIMMFYGIMMSITTAFCMSIAFLLYDVSVTQLISTFLLFAPPLVFSAFWIGFTGLQVVLMFGKRGTELAFVFAWFLTPFSGAYYPVEVLPAWAQKISAVLPMSYVFKGMRGYLTSGQNPMQELVTGYVLGTIYAAFAGITFIYCFNRTKRWGLARLLD